MPRAFRPARGLAPWPGPTRGSRAWDRLSLSDRSDELREIKGPRGVLGRVHSSGATRPDDMRRECHAHVDLVGRGIEIAVRSTAHEAARWRAHAASFPRLESFLLTPLRSHSNTVLVQ
jgi:hypothetical protein